MRTLILPSVGQNLIDGKPSYLNIHPDGQMLIVKSLSCLKINEFDRVIITLSNDDDIFFGAKKLVLNELKKAFSTKIEIIILKDKTKDSVETIYETIKIAKVEGSIVIKDNNNSIKLDKFLSGNFFVGVDLHEIELDNYNIKNKSFVIINEQNHILDIIEKEIKSNLIGVGVYGFNRVEDFNFAFEKLCESNLNSNKLYISNIITYLIGYKSSLFYFFSTDEFEEWSNQNSWIELQKKYTTIFINLDVLLNEFTINSDISKLTELIIKKVNSGSYIIGYTKLDILNSKEIEDFLNYNNINLYQIIYKFTNSKNIKILNNKLDIKKEFD
jgi:hypothetical protein